MTHKKKNIEYIFEHDTKINMLITGGGMSIITDLLTTAGAAAHIDEINIPYASHTLSNWIGVPRYNEIKSSVSKEMATEMANAAYDNFEGDQDCAFFIGIGVTAALRTSRARHSADQAFISVVINGEEVTFHHLLFTGTNNYLYTRIEQDRMVGDTVVSEVARAIRKMVNMDS